MGWNTSRADYWAFRTVFILGNSRAHGMARKTSSQRRLWWWGVLIPLNALISIVGCVVSPLDSCVEIGALLELPFPPANSWTASIDFSGATILKEAVFRLRMLDPIWIVMALQTITSEHRHFQWISIHAPYNLPSTIDPTSLKPTLGESYYRRWMDLDWLLVQFWESRAIRPKIVYRMSREKKGVCEFIGNLLPEITKRGVINLVELWTP